MEKIKNYFHILFEHVTENCKWCINNPFVTLLLLIYFSVILVISCTFGVFMEDKQKCIDNVLSNNTYMHSESSYKHIGHESDLETNEKTYIVTIIAKPKCISVEPKIFNISVTKDQYSKFTGMIRSCISETDDYTLFVDSTHIEYLARD